MAVANLRYINALNNNNNTCERSNGAIANDAVILCNQWFDCFAISLSSAVPNGQNSGVTKGGGRAGRCLRAQWARGAKNKLHRKHFVTNEHNRARKNLGLKKFLGF